MLNNNKETCDVKDGPIIINPNSDNVESGVDLEYERKIMRKIDWRLLPILGVLYSISVIDRTNMASAALSGMTKDLKFSIGDRYSIALLMFFIPYAIFELPSNIALRRVGTAKWLSTIALAWGIVMIGMGFIKDWRVLVVCRTILGFFESGFFPACVYLISSWYVRYEVQKRMAVFFLISILVNGFSPILAYGLMHMDGTSGLAGWRWIFIIEGILTCALALCAYMIIVDFPDKLLERKRPFLTVREIDVVKAIIDRDRNDYQADPLTWTKFKKHISDWKLWAHALIFMGGSLAIYAFVFFMPLILHGMGYTAGMAQLLSAPPAISGAVVGLIFSWLADKTRLRAPFIIIGNILIIVGLSITAYHKKNGIRYLGVFIGQAGATSNIPTLIAYQANNIRLDSKRSVGTALQIGFGAIGGIYASTVFRAKDSPKYVNGMWATMGFQFLMIVLVGTMTLYYKKMNKLHAEGKLKEPFEGDKDFTYTL